MGRWISTSGNARIVGYLLLTLITVVLAAVTGTFALQVGETIQDSPPQAAFEATHSTQEGRERPYCSLGGTDSVRTVITHRYGETIGAGNLILQSSNERQRWSDCSSLDPTDRVAAGRSAAVETSPGATVYLIYQHPGRDETAILFTYESPDSQS